MKIKHTPAQHPEMAPKSTRLNIEGGLPDSKPSCAGAVRDSHLSTKSITPRTSGGHSDRGGAHMAGGRGKHYGD